MANSSPAVISLVQLRYHYDYNSTGTFGLARLPNFTTQGNGQGFGINWSALFPGWPTLSVGYQRGSGSGTLYGTDQESSNSLDLLNVRSSYKWDGFLLNAYYDHTKSQSLFPEFLSGDTIADNLTHSNGQDIGISTSRSLPLWDGSMFANYTHSDFSTDFAAGSPAIQPTSTTMPISNTLASIFILNKIIAICKSVLHQQSFRLLRPGTS